MAWAVKRGEVKIEEELQVSKSCSLSLQQKTNLVLSFHVFNQINQTSGVTHFIVIPGYQFEKSVIQTNTGSGIINR
jgi:hypothetical protein